MASSGDKLSPLFKSLLPDESQLKSATAATVQEAEQRWPLFRAIAPTQPATTPELTDNERLNWASPAHSAAPLSRQARPETGLGDQLAQGLSNMLSAKPVDPSAKIRSKVDNTESLTPPAEKPLRMDLKPTPATTAPKSRLDKERQAAPTTTIQVSEPPLVPPRSILAQSSATAVTASKIPIDPTPAPVPAFARKQPLAPTAEPKPGAFNQTDPIKELAQITTSAIPETAAVPLRTEPQKATTSKPESLKSLFKRLQAPAEPPPEKAPVKKSSFLGRLGKR